MGLYRRKVSEFNKSQEHITSGKKPVDSLGLAVPEFLANNGGTLKFEQITGGEVWQNSEHLSHDHSRVLSQERSGGRTGVLRSPGSSQNSDKRNVSFNEQDEVIFFDKMKKRLNGGNI